MRPSVSSVTIVEQKGMVYGISYQPPTTYSRHFNALSHLTSGDLNSSHDGRWGKGLTVLSN